MTLLVIYDPDKSCFCEIVKVTTGLEYIQERIGEELEASNVDNAEENFLQGQLRGTVS